jgi:hypothetical protein
MSMAAGTHVVLFQKFSNRPIRATTPFYFKDPWLKRRAWNPKEGSGPAPAPPLPEWMMPLIRPCNASSGEETAS